MAVVVGTGVATYVAHVFSELIGHGVLHARRVRAADVRHELRIARPIMSSTAAPALALAAGWAGLYDSLSATLVAFGVVAACLALLGWVIARLGGRAPSWRTFAAGLAFAAAAVAIAAIKVFLTH